MVVGGPAACFYKERTSEIMMLTHSQDILLFKSSYTDQNCCPQAFGLSMKCLPHEFHISFLALFQYCIIAVSIGLRSGHKFVKANNWFHMLHLLTDCTGPSECATIVEKNHIPEW